METEFLNFHDEEHFSDFSLSLEQNLVEKPQDLLIHMVENDFDYMETHLDITNSDNLWNSQNDSNNSEMELPILDNPSVSKLDSIKEDFAKVLTDWQEHIGYLQDSDMDEYMDIIGLNVSSTDKRSLSTSENILLDEVMHSLESDFPGIKQEESEEKSHEIYCNKSSGESSNNDTEMNDKKVESKSLLKESKYSKSQTRVKKTIPPIKSKNINDVNTKQKKKRKEKRLQRDIDKQDKSGRNAKSSSQLPVLQAGDVKTLLEQFEASENTLTSSYSSLNTNSNKEQRDSSSNDIQSHTKQSETVNAKKSTSRMSYLHKNIKNSLPKEMVEKIKVKSRAKSKAINGGLIQLDHDYCSTNSSISSSDSTKSEKQSYVSHSNKNRIKLKECSTDKNAKKDSGMESGEVSDNSEEQSIQIKDSGKQSQSKVKECQKEASSKHNNASANTSSMNNQADTKSGNVPTPEMKIRSALAASILQLRRGMLKQSDPTGNQRVKQMVSVLKKPPNVQQPSVITTANESVVTTTNKLNDTVQNIIVQPDEKTCTPENEKKIPRKKLNLAEYRSRREQRSDNSRTNSPLQPMTLVYIHNASTTTEPIKDDPKNLIWSEREIVSLLKPKSEVEEQKVLPKPPTCDVGIQTYETVFEFPQTSVITVEDERESPARETSEQSCKNQRVRSSSSRSRSRSRSKSKSRSRSRSRSSNRSKSYRRNSTRRRRISHRRSSVSSTSSWSSRSRSHSNTRSSISSHSRYSRSRSRLSRSRSRSSSRYSSCSRSSSRSNFERNRWSRRRRRHSKRYRSYDRDSQRSPSSCRSYRDWKRSSSNSYRRPYENWYDREKQRQVEERRVIYVGRLDEGITKAELRRRFEIFGPVVDISLHFREHGDNYGFVTFAYKNDAYEAVEHGNDNPTLPRYDLCFGGRRAFCKVKYADLDGMASDSFSSGHMVQSNEDNTFDLLLQEAKAKLRKRKV